MADLAKVRVDHAKVRADQAKVSVEERKQQTQSQVKLSGVMGETRQHKQNVVSRPTRQLYDELGGQYPGNFREASEFHRSHVQVDNPMSVTCGSLNTVKKMTPQNVFSHTNPTTQPRAIMNHFLLLKAREAPCTHPLK